MRIAIVTSFPQHPESRRCGVGTASVNLVRSLSHFPDLELHVVTHCSKGTAPGVFDWKGIRVHRLPTPNGSMLRTAIGPGRRQLSEYLLSMQVDLVHAHDTYGLMVQGLGLPRIFTIHGFIYGDTLFSEGKWPWLRSKLWKWFETRGWAEQPHIISISPYVRERLAGIATGTIHDIENPIDEEFFKIERKERKGVIFSTAGISPRKNTLSLLDALAVVLEKGVDAELRLAGPEMVPRYGDTVRRRIRELGMEGKVHLLGWIDIDRVRKELSEASVFALISLEENSPMGIAESMSAGVPVVTSNRCGMPYMVRHGLSGFLVNPHCPDEVADRLFNILENDDLRASMGLKSREIAMDRFHPIVVGTRTRDLYFEVISNTLK